MLSWIALGCLIGAVILLGMLAATDIKTRLLPNEMVVGFATLGIVFHLTTMANFVSVENIAIGGASGFLAMYIIRAIANKAYGQDALGLGDVKLIGAGGIWLGPDAIMLAMAVGALAALIHGAAYALVDARKNKKKPDLVNLQIPAGPGFAVGLIICGIIQFWAFRIHM